MELQMYINIYQNISVLKYKLSKGMIFCAIQDSMLLILACISLLWHGNGDFGVFVLMEKNQITSVLFDIKFLLSNIFSSLFLLKILILLQFFISLKDL